ncbi:hypothetical protein [Streptomyces cucumeris]|uniref:hypothetical protein n=1 Tax=Streptomyces cucumeris TaxID=2962890 RepID=UPI0020C8C914|nr:hypothetical protein [Streptomyces sp. NEAU-Y11]MCP9212953.1 hypothetical protein [Streptomyces sp. NEAU-Y11]
MTRRTAGAGLAAALLCAALVTGCGGGSDDAGASSGTSSDATSSATTPAPSASELADLNRLVDDAESAADVADSDAQKNG